MQCRGIGPHLTAKRKSHGFPRVAVGTWGTCSSYAGDDPSKLMFLHRCPDSCLVTSNPSGISWSLARAIRTLLALRRKTQHPFLVATVILGFLSNFNKSQASTPFESLNSACLSRCQSDVRPPIQMSQFPRVFSRVFTGHSDIPSSCEMKDESAFKPLQGNRDLFQVRAFQCLFHFRQQTQGPSHIPIAEGSLLLRCLWKVDLLL